MTVNYVIIKDKMKTVDDNTRNMSPIKAGIDFKTKQTCDSVVLCVNLWPFMDIHSLFICDLIWIFVAEISFYL